MKLKDTMKYISSSERILSDRIEKYKYVLTSPLKLTGLMDQIVHNMAHNVDLPFFIHKSDLEEVMRK